MGKLTAVGHLRACAETAKSFVSELVAELAQTVFQALEEMDGLKADKPGAVSIEIPADGWEEGPEAAYPWFIDLAVDGLTAQDRADVAIAPEDMEAAVACSMCPTCETISGAIRLRAKRAPSAAIQAQYWIAKGRSD